MSSWGLCLTFSCYPVVHINYATGICVMPIMIIRNAWVPTLLYNMPGLLSYHAVTMGEPCIYTVSLGPQHLCMSAAPKNVWNYLKHVKIITQKDSIWLTRSSGQLHCSACQVEELFCEAHSHAGCVLTKAPFNGAFKCYMSCFLMLYIDKYNVRHALDSVYSVLMSQETTALSNRHRGFTWFIIEF